MSLITDFHVVRAEVRGLHGTARYTTAEWAAKPLFAATIPNPWNDRGIMNPRNSGGISSLLLRWIAGDTGAGACAK